MGAHELAGFGANPADGLDPVACFPAVELVKKILKVDEFVAAIIFFAETDINCHGVCCWRNHFFTSRFPGNMLYQKREMAMSDLTSMTKLARAEGHAR